MGTMKKIKSLENVLASQVCFYKQMWWAIPQLIVRGGGLAREVNPRLPVRPACRAELGADRLPALRVVVDWE